MKVLHFLYSSQKMLHIQNWKNIIVKGFSKTRQDWGRSKPKCMSKSTTNKVFIVFVSVPCFTNLLPKVRRWKLLCLVSALMKPRENFILQKYLCQLFQKDDIHKYTDGRSREDWIGRICQVTNWDLSDMSGNKLRFVRYVR